DLAHGLRDRFVVELTALAEVAEGALKPVGKGVEHDGQCTERPVWVLAAAVRDSASKTNVGRTRWLTSPRWLRSSAHRLRASRRPPTPRCKRLRRPSVASRVLKWSRCAPSSRAIGSPSTGQT